jgi:hypothetical protein
MILLEDRMLGKRRLATMAAGWIGIMVGCADASVGSTEMDRLTSGDGGVHDRTGAGGSSGSSGPSSDAGVHAGGTGGTLGSGGMTGGRGGTAAAGAGTGGHEQQSGADGGAMNSAGAGGQQAGGSGGAGGSAGQSADGRTCMNASRVLPLNPQDAHDGVTLGGFYVDTGTWNAAGYDVAQTMYICDYDDWYVIANMNDDAHDGAVKTYPNVHKDFNDAPPISSFNQISSSFGHTAPHVGIYDFAYDIWLNGVASSGSTEVMIWTDNNAQVPSGPSIDTVTYDGRTYDVHKSGSYIAFVETNDVTAGTVNLLSFFDYVIDKGWIPESSTLGAIDYGVEIVSTDGMDATFEVNAFTLVTN